MNRFDVIKKAAAVMVVGSMLLPTSAAFAASTNPTTGKAYVNSTGSAAADIAILDDAQYDVAGKDTTQEKSSKYKSFEVGGEEIQSDCDVYATIAEGSKVYDPENPNADEAGFVDGKIMVGVPVELILDGTADDGGLYKGSGIVKVKGNIAGTTVINVVPESTVTMSQTGKSDITANISQKYTKFVIPTSNVTGADVNKEVTPDFNDKAVSNVEISTDEATAGSWHGTFTYTISVSNAA